MDRPAIVMNMFYTGLGIARSLGEQGIPVIGLTARPDVYGNYTRYASIRTSPDSREEPEALLQFLLRLGGELGARGVLFPTRDDDVLFLDHYRESLSRYFDLVVSPTEMVRACLDKWETYLHACRAGVDTPRCWVVQNEQELSLAAKEITFPCVMKPLSSHLWRQHDNWERVGGRKAIGIESHPDLLAEYAHISGADSHVLIQELIPGGDDQLFIAACYLDEQSRVVASFAARKLLQYPAGFGTGCIVQTVDCPEVIELAAKLLQSMKFAGVAEVEFKRDPASGRYKLIEVNARPWDQHRLGNACGVDLMHVAYCDKAGLPLPAGAPGKTGHKWIAEDVFLTTALRMAWKRDPQFWRLFALARGRRIYGIWSRHDVRPFTLYMAKFVPRLIWGGLRQIGTLLGRFFRSRTSATYRRSLHDANVKG